MRSSIAIILSATAATVSAQADGCSPLHLIYARATTEPPSGVDNANAQQFEAAANRGWSKGYGAAGYSLFSNVTKLIPGSTGWPVHYPASWSGCTSEDKGVEDILNQIKTKAAACPNQKYVLGGHSQGGVVTVRAIPQIPRDILPRILAVTMFGSPSCPTEVKDRCKSFCNQGDSICSGTGDPKANGRCGTGAAGGAGASAKGAGGPPGMGAKGMGGAKGAGFPKGMGGMGVPPKDDSADKKKREEQFIRSIMQQDPMCAGPEVAEKGHQAKGSEGAHLLYNKDGYYIKAAACYIYKRFHAAQTGGS